VTFAVAFAAMLISSQRESQPYFPSPSFCSPQLREESERSRERVRVCERRSSSPYGARDLQRTRPRPPCQRTDQGGPGRPPLLPLSPLRVPSCSRPETQSSPPFPLRNQDQGHLLAAIQDQPGAPPTPFQLAAKKRPETDHSPRAQSMPRPETPLVVVSSFVILLGCLS
jgi:hypothetical protein